MRSEDFEPENEVLSPLAKKWCEKLRISKAIKEEQFWCYAKEIMGFVMSDEDVMYPTGKTVDVAATGCILGEGNQPELAFKIAVNKGAEYRDLVGPYCYYQNPDRTVSPRDTGIDPMMAARRVPMPPLPPGVDPMAWQQMVAMYQQQIATQFLQFSQQQQQDRIDRSQLVGSVLNYTPMEFNLWLQSRRAVDQANLVGAGIVVTKMYRHEGTGTWLPGSFWVDVEDLFLDQDVTTMEDCTWAAIRYCAPAWRLERDYGLPPGSLKPYYESYNAKADVLAENRRYEQSQGYTSDLVEYYEIYSRSGLGQHLEGYGDADTRTAYKKVLSQFGDNVFLAVVPGCPYPLNIPPSVMDAPDDGTGSMFRNIEQRIAWPIPWWKDSVSGNGWPFTMLSFRFVPGQLWPQAPLQAAMGLLRFINWATSFLAGKVQRTCRDFLAVLQELPQEVRSRLLYGKDLEIVEITVGHKTIAEMVQFIQHPNFNKDILSVLELVVEWFNQSTGLNELMYGQTSRQMRSGTEANLLAQRSAIRPEDMANTVENWQGVIARKEGLALRWMCRGNDVARIIGKQNVATWDQLFPPNSPETADELDYGVEAGSARKKNYENNLENMNQAAAMWLPVLQQFAVVGQVGPLNAFKNEWAKSRGMDPADIPDFMPPPPPMPPAGEEQPVGDSQKEAA